MLDQLLAKALAEIDDLRARNAYLEARALPEPRPSKIKPRSLPSVTLDANDPRHVSNTSAHVPKVYAGDNATPARMAKHRRAVMEACPCRLCALCLAPPATFAEAALLGVEQIGINGVREMMGWDQQECGDAFDQGAAQASQERWAETHKEECRAEREVLAIVRERGSGLGAMRVDNDGNKLVWDKGFEHVIAEGKSWAEVLAILQSQERKAA